MSTKTRRLVLVGLLALLLGAACDQTHPCTTEIAPPSGAEPEELVWLVADATGDWILDHPLFAEVYDVLFADNDAIPSALDIVQVEVVSEGELYAIHIRTRQGERGEGNIMLEMSREDQRVAFGVYIDSDGNGLSDYLLSTTDSPERGVILTPEFKLVGEMPRLAFERNEVTMTVPKELVGARFDWLAFSGYSPTRRAFHTTAQEQVFFVPQVDIVGSVSGMMGVVTFYAGPGACQVVDSRSTMRCPVAAGTPLTTIPGTTIQGKLWYRKRCGATEAAFWCVGGAFGARVAGGPKDGWVGKCPYLCGANWIDAWDSNNDGSLDKVWHIVYDADCSDPQNVMKHYDQDNDNKMDHMEHTYWFATGQLRSCNPERNENTGSLILPTRCCPDRAPYANQYDVPGPGIDGAASPYNCPVSAP